MSRNLFLLTQWKKQHKTEAIFNSLSYLSESILSVCMVLIGDINNNLLIVEAKYMPNNFNLLEYIEKWLVIVFIDGVTQYLFFLKGEIKNNQVLLPIDERYEKIYVI